MRISLTNSGEYEKEGSILTIEDENITKMLFDNNVFKKKINSLLEEDNVTINNKLVSFNQGDLLLAVHDFTLNLKANKKENENWNLDIKISDKNIIKGYYKDEEYFDPFATQDAVDYCKYYYTNKYDSIFSNKYQKISKENIEEIKDYFSNFREWMNACDRLDEYDFVEEIIDNNDFYLLNDKSNYKNSIEYKKFEYFTIHFYDTNSHILYYIHANI